MKPTIVNPHSEFQLGKVDERIFGGFLEHLGRAVYQGVYDPDHPQADQDGLRQDVRQALERLKVTIAIGIIIPLDRYNVSMNLIA